MIQDRASVSSLCKTAKSIFLSENVLFFLYDTETAQLKTAEMRYCCSLKATKELLIASENGQCPTFLETRLLVERLLKHVE